MFTEICLSPDTWDKIKCICVCLEHIFTSCSFSHICKNAFKLFITNFDLDQILVYVVDFHLNFNLLGRRYCDVSKVSCFSKLSKGPEKNIFVLLTLWTWDMFYLSAECVLRIQWHKVIWKWLNSYSVFLEHQGDGFRAFEFWFTVSTYLLMYNLTMTIELMSQGIFNTKIQLENCCALKGQKGQVMEDGMRCFSSVLCYAGCESIHLSSIIVTWLISWL